MNRAYEYKATTAPALSVSGKQVRVLFATSGNVDRQQDVMTDTALDAWMSARADQLPLMWNHSFDLVPLGIVEQVERVGRKGLPDATQARFPDASGGWIAEAKILDTDRGTEFLAALKSGLDAAASFGYLIKRARQGKSARGTKARLLEQVDIFEISALPPGMGANEAAGVLKALQLRPAAASTRSIAELNAELRAFERWRDETTFAMRLPEIQAKRTLADVKRILGR